MQSNWVNKPLGELVALQRGHDLPSQDRIEGNVPIMGSSGLTGFHNKAKTSGPGVVIGRSGNSMGEVTYCPVDFWPLNTCLYITDFKNNDKKYIYYLLKTFNFDQFNSGSAQKSLNRNAVYPFEVRVTESREEQIQIGQILSNLENKIEINNQINQTLESIAQAVFISWFIDFEPVKAKLAAKLEGHDPEVAAMCAISGKSEAELEQMDKVDFVELQAKAALFPDELVDSELGEVPRGWEVSTVGEKIQTVGGATPSTKNPEFWDNGQYHWTTPKDLSNLTDKILLNTDRKITASGLKKISSGLLPKNTVLMSSRAPVGYLALAKIEVAINQGYIAILPNTKYSAEYLIQWCEANMAEIKGRASGTTFQEISKKNFREINFLCPAEQILIAYARNVQTLYNQISSRVIENQSLIKIRDTLLPKLLSGEVEVSSMEEVVHD